MGWRWVVQKAFGHRTLYLMVRDEHGEVRGVLARKVDRDAAKRVWAGLRGYCLCRVSVRRWP